MVKGVGVLVIAHIGIVVPGGVDEAAQGVDRDLLAYPVMITTACFFVSAGTGER